MCRGKTGNLIDDQQKILQRSQEYFNELLDKDYQTQEGFLILDEEEEMEEPTKEELIEVSAR